MSTQQPPSPMQFVQNPPPISERVRYFSKQIQERGIAADDMDLVGMGIALGMVADDIVREVEGKQP